MVGPIDVKQKGGAWLDAGWPWPLTSPMTLTIDFSRANFKIAVSQELLSDVKQKESISVRYWADCMVLPFLPDNRTTSTGWRPWPHPWPWPCGFKVKVWNSLIQGMGGMIEMERKGCELIIHDHDCDLRVTMVGWVDVPQWLGWLQMLACCRHIWFVFLFY